MTALERLLRPKTVAVVGGEEAERVVNQLDLLGYTGEVWPVHLTRATISGRTSVASVEELPGGPDVAFTAVPREVTPAMVESLAQLGTGGVVVYTSGFGESGDLALERDLIEAAGDMPLIGPNCYGYVNALDGTAIWPDVHGMTPVGQGVAIITQSGNIGINVTMAQRSLDIGLLVTAGNQSVIDIAALMESALDDPRITAIGVQLEDLKDSQAFGRAALRAAAEDVPLVGLKMGTSKQGALATASHTGALAGDKEAYNALFARYGVARVGTIPAFLETLKLAGKVGPAPRVISLSSSGGEAAHVADLAHMAGVDLPELSPKQVDSIAATVDELVTISNPMDYHTVAWGNEEDLARTFGAVVDAPFDIALLVLDFPADDMSEAWWIACRAFARAVRGKPGLVVATIPETMTPAIQERVGSLGLIPMLGLAETIEAIASLGDAEVDTDTELHSPGRAATSSMSTLDEADSKELIAAVGVTIPDGFTTDDPLSAPVQYPATVKVLGIDHKLAVGGVSVGVPDEMALRDTLARMPRANGFLVETTVVDPLAELLVSVRAIDRLGWMLTIGSGGALVEALGDRVHFLTPVARETIEEVLTALVNVDAVVDAIVAVQRLVERDDRILEVEINPLMVTETEAVAVDAMVTLR